MRRARGSGLAGAVRSARFTRPLTGSPINFADCSISSPIGSQGTGARLRLLGLHRLPLLQGPQLRLRHHVHQHLGHRAGPLLRELEREARVARLQVQFQRLPAQALGFQARALGLKGYRCYENWKSKRSWLASKLQLQRLPAQALGLQARVLGLQGFRCYENWNAKRACWRPGAAPAPASSPAVSIGPRSISPAA